MNATNFTVVKSDMTLTLTTITGDLWNPTIELDTPTIAREMPKKIRRRAGFSATNATQGSKARLHQTEPRNRLPTSKCCPVCEIRRVGMQAAKFGHYFWVATKSR